MEIADLRVKFNAEGQAAVQNAIRKTDSDIKNLANNSIGNANRMSGAFSGAGKAIALGFGAIAAVGIGKAIGGLINMNAQAETLKTQLDIATGSAERSNAVFSDMQKLAAATPFEFPELVASAARIESFGLSSQKVMGTIGDTAAGTGRGLEQVTNAYLDAGMGQFIRLQELGIDAATVGDKVVLKWVENGKTLSKSVDKNNGLIIQSTVEAIWNKKYAGAMKKQSKTFNGMMSTFKDNVKLTMAEATKPVFEFAKNGLDAANRFFDRFADKRAMGLGVWAAAMSSLQVTLDQVFGKTAGGAIIGVIRGIGSAVSSVVGAIGELGGALRSGDIGGFFSLLGADLIALASATVVKIPSLAVEIGGWLISTADDLWEKIKRAVFGWLGGSTSTSVPVPGTGGMSAVSVASSIPIGTVAVAIGDWTISAIQDLHKTVVDKIGGWWAAIKNAGITLAGYAVRLSQWVVTDGASLAKSVIDKFVAWWPAIKDTGVDLAGMAINLTSMVVKSISGWAADAATAIQTWIDGNSPGSFVTAINLSGFTVAFGEGAQGNWAEAVRTLLTADPIKITPEIELNITEAVANAIADPLPNFSRPSLNINWTPILAGMVGNLPFAASIWAATKIVPDIVRALGAAVKGVPIGIGRWNLDLKSPSEIRWDAGLGGPAKWIYDRIVANGKLAVKGIAWTLGLLTPDINAGGLLGGAVGIGGAVKGWIYDKIKAAGDISVSVISWALKLPLPKITGSTLTGLAMQLPLWVAGAVSKVKDLTVSVISWILKLPVPTSFGWLTDSIGDIWGAIKKAANWSWDGIVSIPDISFDIPTPNVPEWLKKLAGGDWKGAIQALGGVTGAGGTGNAVDPFAFEQDPTYFRPDNGPRVPGVDPATGQPTYSMPGAMKVALKLNFTGTGGEDLKTYADAEINKQLASVLGDAASAGAKNAKDLTVKTTFAADTGPAAKAYTAVMAWGQVFQKTTFTSKFAIDLGLAARAYTDAFTWGGAWARALFTSTFSINTGPAAIAYTNAFSWGSIWANQTFTARFSVDTSGLFAAIGVARYAAQQIRDLMPSSPAKKGPLSTPITFDYIADSMAGTMARIVPLARSGMAGVAGYLSPDAGASFRSGARGRALSGGKTTVITYIIEKGAFVGRYAEAEIEQMVASGAIKVVDQRMASSRTSGRS